MGTLNCSTAQISYFTHIRHYVFISLMNQIDNLCANDLVACSVNILWAVNKYINAVHLSWSHTGSRKISCRFWIRCQQPQASSLKQRWLLAQWSHFFVTLHLQIPFIIKLHSPATVSSDFEQWTVKPQQHDAVLPNLLRSSSRPVSCFWFFQTVQFLFKEKKKKIRKRETFRTLRGK